MKKTKLILGIFIGLLMGGLIGIKASVLIKSEQVMYKDNKTVNIALDELFEEVGNAKALIAAAITDKGIATSENDSFEQIAHNISLLRKAVNTITIKVPFIWTCISTYDTNNKVTKVTTMTIIISNGQISTVSFDIASNGAAGNNGGSTSSSLTGLVDESSYDENTGVISATFKFYSKNTGGGSYTHSNNISITLNANDEIESIDLNGTYSHSFEFGISKIVYNDNATSTTN